MFDFKTILVAECWVQIQARKGWKGLWWLGRPPLPLCIYVTAPPSDVNWEPILTKIKIKLWSSINIAHNTIKCSQFSPAFLVVLCYDHYLWTKLWGYPTRFLYSWHYDSIIQNTWTSSRWRPLKRQWPWTFCATTASSLDLNFCTKMFFFTSSS